MIIVLLRMHRSAHMASLGSHARRNLRKTHVSKDHLSYFRG